MPSFLKKIFRHIRPRAFKFLVVRWLDPLFEKSPRNVIFIVKPRTIFSANHRVVCEYLIREKMNCNIAVFAPGAMPSMIENELSRYNIKLFRSFSISYLRYLFSAGVVFISHSVRDSFISKPNQNRKVVNYWHGATYKKIENRMGNLETSKEKLIERNAEIYNYLVASCRGDQELMSQSFGMPAERVFPTGLPRYDLFKNYERIFHFSDKTEQLFSELRSNYEKVILYAPTFRESAGSPLFGVSSSDFKALNDYLKLENYHLVVRPHYYDEFVITEKYSNISMLPHWDHPESNIVLSSIDLLVVDYSSIWIDFLLTNKPIIFLQQDYEHYSVSERGLNYEQKFLPGEVVPSFNDYDHSISCSRGLELALNDVFVPLRK